MADDLALKQKRLRYLQLKAKAGSQEAMGSSDMPQPKGVGLGTAFEVASEMAPWNVARGLTTEPLGEAVAEAGGRMGYPTTGAALGTGIQMAPDIAGAFLQGPKTRPMGAFAAKTSPLTAPGVDAARRWGVPLTRAEVTGKRSDSLMEAGLAKTITGADRIQEGRQVQAAAIESALGRVQDKYGTRLPPSSVGQEAQLGMQSEMGQAAQTNRGLWADIPDVQISTPKLSQALDDAAAAQSGIQDQKVISVISKIRAAIARQAPITEAGSASSVRPIKPATQGPPRFNELQKARKFLNESINAETTWDPVLGMKTTDTGRQLQQIKKALDSDIGGFGNVPDLPVVQPGSKTGDPHALFAYNENLGQGFPKESKYQLWGDPSNPVFKNKNLVHGSQATGKQLEGSGIHITGRTPESVGKWEPLDMGGVDKFQAGPFKTAFQNAKGFHGTFKGLTGSKMAKRVSSSAPSDMVDSVLKPGRVEDAITAKALMGEEGFKSLKQGFVNRLLESKNLGRELAKYDDEFLNSVFNPEELGALKDMVAIKGRAMGAEKLAGNPSGTGQTIGMFGTGIGLVNAAKKLFTGHPIEAASEATALLGGPIGGANMYMKYGVSGVPVLSERAGSAFQSLGLTANSAAQSRRALITQYIEHRRNQ